MGITSNTLHSALDTQHTTSKKPSIHRHHKHLQHPYIHITMSQLSYARYGKDNIRLYKVKRNGDGTQDVVEMTVRILLEGDIETSYTEADNSVVVATDTQKHTCYILAKQNPIQPPELFASIIGDHFVSKYSHIHACQRAKHHVQDERPDLGCSAPR